MAGVPITRIVNATLTRLGGTLPAAGFGIPLGLHQLTVGEQATAYATYTNTAEMVLAGIPTTSTAHAWATVVQSQSPRPEKWAIGRRVPGTAQVETVTITTTEDGVWTLDEDGTPVYAFIVAGGADDVAVAAGLEAQIRADSESRYTVEAVATTTSDFEVTAKIAGDPFTLTISPPGGPGAGTVVNATANAAAGDVSDALDAVEVESTLFFRFSIDSRNNTDILEAASWAAARRWNKEVFAQSSDPLMIATEAGTSIGALLAAQSYGNTHLSYHSGDGAFNDGGLVGKASAFDMDTPGRRFTYANMQLIGVPVDSLVDSQVDNIEANHGNAYVQVLGATSATLPGIGVDDQFFDLEDTDSWVKNRIQEAQASLILLTNGVPFDNEGINALNGAGKGVMSRGVTIGHFNGDDPLTNSSPLSSQITPADKAARILRGLTYGAQYRGFIHKVLVTVDLKI